MTPERFIEVFREARASAILRTNDADGARSAMDAAVRGGFRIVEFTLTTPGALELIREFSKRESLVVGAGTVLTLDEAHAAVDAGAQFLVSPVIDEAVINAAKSRHVAMMPGCFTPTEMLRAYRAGAPLIKLFPAPGTGPKYLKSVLGPLPFLRIVPTNGVDLNNVEAWFKAGAVAVGFTTALFDANDLAAGAFDRVESRAKELLAAARGA